MTIKEVLERKRLLEVQIVDLVNELVENFQKETELTPNSIELELCDVAYIGDRSKEFVVTDCNVVINI